MNRHVTDVLACGDKDHADYILGWSAWGLQNPELPAEVGLAFRGGEGTGKGTFLNALRRLYGVHGIQLANRQHIIGRFNSHLMSCCFVNSDEALWPGNKEDAAVLRSMLTEPTLTVEAKGIDAVQMPNRLKWAFSGNDSWMLPAAADARRYAIFDVSPKHAQDRTYFGRLKRETDNGGLEAMLFDLLAMRLKGWHPADNVPHTKALADQKQMSADPQVLWLGTILDEGTLPDAPSKKPNRAPTVSLYASMRSSSRKMEYVSDLQLKTFLRQEGVTFKRSNGIWAVFPPLQKMRAAWMKKRSWWHAFEEDSAGADWSYAFADVED
jgi:hypothetical protein